MATLIAETQWHGNPRPTLAYASGVFIEEVASPYYKDGRNVPVTKHYVTNIPLTDLAPTATIQEAGPAPLVGWEIDGLWSDPTILSVGITVTGGTNISTAIQFSTDILGPAQASETIAGVLRGLSDEIFVEVVGQETYITPVAPATSLTITTLTVA